MNKKLRRAIKQRQLREETMDKSKLKEEWEQESENKARHYIDLANAGESLTGTRFDVRPDVVVIWQELADEEEPDKYVILRKEVSPRLWQNLVALAQKQRPLREVIVNETHEVGDYVEYQPMHGKQPRGRSKNVRITKVLADGKYETNIGKTISTKEILGKNLQFTKTKEDATESKNKLKLITGAQAKSEHDRMIVENFITLAKSVGEDPKKLIEGATQVLAGLRTIMSQGKPLNTVGLSTASLAGVVAGIEVLTNNLAKLEPAKKTKALTVLSALALGANMSLNAVQAIASLAEKNPNKPQLQQAFDQYAQTKKADPKLLQALGQLQAQVDQATRTATIDKPTAPTTVATHPGSAAPLGQPAV